MDLEKRVIELDVSDVLPNRFQPRIKFNEESIIELSESIREHGVLQPILVRSIGDKYEIIAGERRYKASLLVGKKTIPAIILDLKDKDIAEVALIENVQRKDLTPIEEAISYKKILDMGYITQEDLAAKVGKTQSTIANKIRLLNLDEEVQEALLEEKISERHARSLLRISDSKTQREILEKIIENRMTVRATDDEIEKLLKKEKEPEKNERNNIKPNFFDDNEEEKVIIIEEKVEDMDFRDNNTNASLIFDPFSIEKSSDNEQILEPNSIFAEKKEINQIQAEKPISSEFTFTEIKQEEGIKPGFMDIDKIENEAMDINNERPVADLNTLLHSASIPNISPVSTPFKETNEVKINKPEEEDNFFMFPKKQEEETKNETQIFSANPFDFRVEPFSPIKPVEEPQPVNSQAFNNLPSLEEKVIEPVKEESPFINFKPLEEPFKEVAIESFDIFDTTKAPSEEKEADFLNPNFDFNISAPIMREEIKFDDPNSIISSPILTEFDSVPNLPIVNEIISVEPLPTQKNITNALEIIKECEKKLRENGFNVSMEEIDFETVYNVNLKIQK